MIPETEKVVITRPKSVKLFKKLSSAEEQIPVNNPNRNAANILFSGWLYKKTLNQNFSQNQVNDWQREYFVLFKDRFVNFTNQSCTEEKGIAKIFTSTFFFF